MPTKTHTYDHPITGCPWRRQIWGKFQKWSPSQKLHNLGWEGCTKTLPPSIPVNLYAAVDLPSLPGVSRTGGSPSKNQTEIQTNTNTQINVHKCRHLEPTTVIVFARKIQIETHNYKYVFGDFPEYKYKTMQTCIQTRKQIYTVGNPNLWLWENEIQIQFNTYIQIHKYNFIQIHKLKQRNTRTQIGRCGKKEI